MDLKTVEIEGVTYAEVKDGKPVFLDGGKEIAVDVAGSVAKIASLNHEAMQRRQALEDATAKLKAFEGIEDPKAAMDALKTVANFKDKDLIDAAKVEEIKAAAIKATEDKFAPYVEKATKLEDELRRETIGGSFARSKFIQEKLAIPADFVEHRFGAHFDRQDGKIVAKDGNGNPIYSKERPGEPASFDEALEFLVSQYPQRDSILKGSGASGSGAAGGEGAPAGKKVISRAEYEKLDPFTQGSRIREGYTLTD